MANSQDSAEKQQSFNVSQNAISNYNRRLSTLPDGGQIGANPWQNPSYLANANKLQANLLDSATNAGKAELVQQDRRTGGMNGSATTYGIRDLALNKARMGDALSAGRAAADYNSNVQYQRNLLSGTLAPASAEQGYYTGIFVKSGTSATNFRLI